MIHAATELCVPCTGTDASQHKIKSANTVHIAVRKGAALRILLAGCAFDP